MADLAEDIAQSLRGSASPTSDFDLNPAYSAPEGRALRPAAVLLALVPDGQTAQVVLTKRSQALKHHPGQVAFPGGKKDDADETLAAAALREAQEEVGLEPSSVRILGELPPHETVTGFRVTPFVGWVDGPFEPVPEAGEVDEVFHVPLDHLCDPARFVVQSRVWRGQLRHYYAVPYGPYYIWGATARMLRVFAALRA